MVTVGEFSMNYDNNSDIQVTFTLTGTKIVWPKGSPPKDSPECGFDNEKCPPKSTDAESGKTMSDALLFLQMQMAGTWSIRCEVSWNSCDIFWPIRQQRWNFHQPNVINYHAFFTFIFGCVFCFEFGNWFIAFLYSLEVISFDFFLL